jgi:peptidyl-prolyl cis-trans isomerase C
MLISNSNQPRSSKKKKLSYPYCDFKEYSDSQIMHTIALHHILLKSPLLADDLAKELELGADFAELAREYSACPSAQQGGFAGYHSQDDLPISIIEALARSDDQQSYTGPITSSYGYHLLKPVGEKPKLALSDENILLENSDEDSKDDKIPA